MRKNTKPTKLIIFDFDDTLEDYSSAAKKCTKKLMDLFSEKYGIPKTATKRYIRYLNKKYVEYGRRTFDPKSLDRNLWFQDYSDHFRLDLSDKEIKKIVDYYWKITLEEVELFKGAKELLQELSKNKEYKLIILSDSDGSRKIKMDRIGKFGIERYFDAIITSDDTKTNKPSQNNYFYILKRYDALPKDCIMLGDKPEFDLLPAKKLGMKTIWVKRGWWARITGLRHFRYVDYQVKNMRDINKIINSVKYEA